MTATIIFLISLLIGYQKPKILIRIIFFLLPIYLIRLSFFAIPTTFLEVLVLGFIFATGIEIWKKGLPKRVVKQAKKQEYKLLYAGLCAIVLGAIINTVRLDSPVEALGVLKSFYIEPVLFGVALWYHQKVRSVKEDVILGLVWSGGVTSLFGIYQKATGFGVPYAFWENRNTYRITGWWGFPNGVGLFLAPIVPMGIGLWKKSKKNGYLVFTGAMVASIIFAKSTGALVALCASIAVYLIYKKKTRMPTLIGGGVLALLLLLWSPLSSIKQELLLQDFSGNLRKDIWRETGAYLETHWWLGAGLEQYPKEIAPYRTNKNIEIFHHPHNMLLTYWVETGLLGAIGYVFLVIYIAIRIVKQKKGLSPLHYALLIFLVTGLVDSPHIKNDLAIFWISMLVLVD